MPRPRRSARSLDGIKPDDPLRLEVAAALAFPDGSMTASGLRKEASRGRLVIERIAGKDYTTLSAIDEMRELCRRNASPRGCGSNLRGATPPARSSDLRHGTSKTETIERARAAARAMLTAQRTPSQNTSTESTSKKHRGGAVEPIRFPLATSSRSISET